MNVAFDPWIPVIDHTGNRKHVSLFDIFQHGKEYRDLVVYPHERVALMRLLVLTTHAVMNGPNTVDDWRRIPDTIAEFAYDYLNKWRDSFELHHEEKPWLQSIHIYSDETKKRIPDEKWNVVNKMCFSTGQSANSTMFDHKSIANTIQPTTVSDLIIALLTFQCFSSSGTITPVIWNDTKTSRYSQDSLCLTASMLHTFIRMNNMLETIQLNTPNFEFIQRIYHKYEIGRPVWEQYPSSKDDKNAIVNATETYLGRLVPIKRLIWIHPNHENILLGDGPDYPVYSDGFPTEPTASLLLYKNGKKEEKKLVSYNSSRAVWRQLSSILIKRNANGFGGPLALNNIDNLTQKTYEIQIVAVSRSQANILDISESLYHISDKFFNEERRTVYENEIEIAEKVESTLKWAIDVYRESIDDAWQSKDWQNKTKLSANACSYYWTQLETNLHLLLDQIDYHGSDQYIQHKAIWRKFLFDTSKTAYQRVCGNTTPRQIRAYAKGSQKFGFMWNHIILDNLNKEVFYDLARQCQATK